MTSLLNLQPLYQMGNHNNFPDNQPISAFHNNPSVLCENFCYTHLMKTVGIIGGLGPETTAKFYLEIISNSQHQNNEARPPILMWSIPLPLGIEEDLITRAQGEERYLPFMIDAAKRLEKGGADFIVIPCNSVHIFINEVRSSVNIPVLSIIEETLKFLKNKSISKVGLLATS